MTIMQLIEAFLAVFTGYGLVRFIRAWRADTRAAAIRQEMSKDHAREEWLKTLATWQRPKERL